METIPLPADQWQAGTAVCSVYTLALLCSQGSPAPVRILQGMWIRVIFSLQHSLLTALSD